MSLHLSVFVFVAVLGWTVPEKVFHSRDHSDVEMSSSHLAELITDTDSAQVSQRNTLHLCTVQLHMYWCRAFYFNTLSPKQKETFGSF